MNFIYFTLLILFCFFFFFQAEDGIRDGTVTGVQTCALPILAGLLAGASVAQAGAPAPRPLSLTKPGSRAKETADRLVSVDRQGDRADRSTRSEERRVGKECRSRWSPDH